MRAVREPPLRLFYHIGLQKTRKTLDPSTPLGMTGKREALLGVPTGGYNILPCYLK